MSVRACAPAALLAAVGCAALAGCVDATATRRQNAEAHYRMATAALQQPGGIQSEVNRRAAYPELTQAIGIEPGNAQFHQTLGAIYFYGEDYGAAEGEFKRALALDPKAAEAHNNLGLVYLAQEHPAEAAGEFKKALANLAYPTPEIAAFNLGNAQYRLGNYEEAIEAYERSLKILPENFDGQFGVGLSYARLGRLAEAERAYAEAARLRPDAVRAHYELGMTLFKLGRKGEAAAQFRRVVELEPAGELGEQSRIYLKLIK
ncbi:MAG TPA: tetratricopeptide repeat protein [bacterium]